MTSRRLFLTLMAPTVSAAPCKQGSKVPVEPYELNPFVSQMNLYIELRARGEVSLDQWKRVLRAWDRMTGN